MQKFKAKRGVDPEKQRAKRMSAVEKDRARRRAALRKLRREQAEPGVPRIVGPDPLIAPPNPELPPGPRPGGAPLPLGIRPPSPARPEAPAAGDVHVEMGYFLIRIPAVIGEDAIAALGKTKLTRRMADRAHEAGDLRIRRVGREIVHRDIGALRDRQHMHRRLRVDVVEDEAVLVLIDGLVGDLAPQDLGEDVLIVVVGHRSLG